MLERFYPGAMEASAYQIPYEMYRERGIRGVIFDIDNTLVPHGAPADAAAVRLFQQLHEMGLSTCLLSNNKEPRVREFARAVNSPYLYKGGKPAARGYREAMKRMGTEEKTTIFVGDQLFTDVYGANRAGIFSILVKPIHPREEIQIVLKRCLERPVLWSYRRKMKQGERR